MVPNSAQSAKLHNHPLQPGSVGPVGVRFKTHRQPASFGHVGIRSRLSTLLYGQIARLVAGALGGYYLGGNHQDRRK